MRYLVGAACLALMTAGCGSGSKSAAATSAPTATTTETRVTVTGKYRYPPNVISSFMRSCTQGNAKLVFPAKQNFCACVIDRLSNSVSTRDFAHIARTGKTIPRVARAIRQATVACRATG